jgi:hypothetical protein
MFWDDALKKSREEKDVKIAVKGGERGEVNGDDK